MSKQRNYRPQTLKLSEIQDPEVRQRLENQFEGFNAQRALSNEAIRKAAIADADSVIAQQTARKAFINLLLETGEYLDPIKVEQMWTVYRRGGDVVFECPFSESDMRKAMHVQRADLDQRAREISGDDVDDLYHDENEDPET